MNRTLFILAGALLLVLGSCNKNEKRSHTALLSEQDSVAYVIGMNIGQNLQQMDTTLNVEALCQGLRDAYMAQAKFTHAEARDLYLHYQYISKPEAAIAYEREFLEEIVERDRSYARSKSGLTYAVAEVGNVERTPRSSSDSLTLLMVGKRLDGTTFYSSLERGDSLRLRLGDLNQGLQEALKLIGDGGRITCYLPAELGYGAAGCDSLGIQPNATLYYEIDLVEVTRPSRRTGSNRRNSLEF
uniref:FKBP-type peptidyl-prolyl cis-trans isomerase n=1 Tax=Alistipes sp. TaxID=1872444 RepID=UPI004056A132